MSEEDISFYPPPPLPGSNAFGQFAFGISPFGTVSLFDWRKTVIAQYANSPTLLSLIESWYEALDQTQDIDNFFDSMFNVATATGYGLDVWGAIVGVSRNLAIDTAGDYFGFEQGDNWDTFGVGGVSPFYTGQPLTDNYTLTDRAYRQLIFAKALANICDGSIPALNAILMSLFGPDNPFGPEGSGGKCYVTNGANMTMTFTFEFALTPIQNSIIFKSGVLPIPGGVEASIVVVP